MKRFGYTLAEALIALAIVGVVAAIVLPMANKFMPDGNKVIYLKTYDSLVEAVQQMATNTVLYPIADNTYSYEKAPLANTMAVTLDGKTYSGEEKFCKILASMFGEENPNCSKESWPSFTTKNGVEFLVHTSMSQTGANVEFHSIITIDVNGEKGKNLVFNTDNCVEPDRFLFEVAANGKVIASDIKGQEYLATRTNARKLTKDSSQTIRNELGIKKIATLGEEDTKIALTTLPREYPLGLLKPTPIPVPIPVPVPVPVPDPKPVPVPVPDPTPDPEIPLIDPLPEARTCAGCGRPYVASTNCTCSCGAPIICKGNIAEPLK